MEINGDFDMSKITKLHYNYRPAASDGRDIYDEDYDVAEIGKRNVTNITEHLPEFNGDRLWYDIYYTDTIVRTYNPCEVHYER